MSQGENEDDKILQFDKSKRKIKDEIDEELYSTDTDDAIDNVIQNTSFGVELQVLEEMNKKHAIINNYGGRSMVSRFNYSPATGRKELAFSDISSLKLQYCNQSMPVADRVVELGTWWLKHPRRKEYETVMFDPSKPREHEGCLNLWEGLGTSPIRGSWDVTRSHVKKILCNNDKTKFDYFIKWLAWCVQNPADRAEVAVIFKGRQGAGKGFIFTQMIKIFGKHGMAISNRKHLTGGFNGHFKQLVFLFADEAYYPGDKEVEGTLKQLITEPMIAIEAKFQDTRLGKNCLKIGMASNNDWVIPASADSRRYFINTVDNSYSKGACADKVRTNYFKNLWDEMDYNGGREAMLYDLLSVNVSNWHPRNDVPETDELRHQITMSLSRPHRLVLDFVNNGVFPGIFEAHSEQYIITAEELMDYLESLSPKHNISMAQIAPILKPLGCRPSRYQSKRAWEFPKLSHTRINWCSAYGVSDWDNGGEWQLKNTAF